ncbi:MAG: hypothetical protein U5R06_17060 [candidate division KSB1 bacterium]|nr:hypothetical protein [candidate division KSB1 bacterium]
MMKKYVVFVVIFMLIQAAAACDIKISVHGESKKDYHTGDEVIFKVDVHLTHRNCPHGIKATQFTGDGLELLGATPWKKVSEYDYVRLVKAKVQKNADSKAVLKAVRSCDKGGAAGSGEIQIK